MTPYYEDDWCTIYHGDCRALLPLQHATITDPPYGTGHYATDNDDFDAEMLGILVDSGTTSVFGWPERLVAICVAAGRVPDEWVTWWPTNAAIKAAPTSKGLLREAECVAVFGSFASLRVERTGNSARLVPKAYKSAKARGESQGDPEHRQAGDVWTDTSPGLGFQSHSRLHPNEKPLSIMHSLVKATVPAGACVVDPFMGSGTTLRAAKDLGRHSIGIELEEKYCEIAAKRLAQEVLDFGGAA